MTKEKYIEILEKSFEQCVAFDECLETRLEFLGDYIFNFTTYDGEISSFFAVKALEVCKAITNRETFSYIEDEENYKWFLIMCNMPFFSEKIGWGTSMRGSWWEGYKGITLESCGLYINGKPTLEMKFNQGEWEQFVEAMIEWSEAK